jgi:hypothetical protein
VYRRAEPLLLEALVELTLIAQPIKPTSVIFKVAKLLKPELHHCYCSHTFGSRIQSFGN